MRFKVMWIFVGLLALLIVGCRQQAATPSTTTATINIAVNLPDAEPTTGATKLEVILTDAAGQPLDGASVSVRGDMTHPGMIPVIAETSASTNGTYSIPFEWTMGGEWILTVSATLPDGTTTSQEFEYVVKSGG